MNRYNDYLRDGIIIDKWGNKLTHGKWSLSRKTMYALFRGCSNLLAVMLRQKMGVEKFSRGKLFWMILVLMLAWLIAYTSEANTSLRYLSSPSIQSTDLIYLHGWFAIILFTVKWVIAVLSIGTTSKWFRPRDSMGRSISWPIIALFLRPLKLAPKSGEKARFFQMSERKWMLFIEPIGLLCIVQFWYVAGYTIYGNLLFIVTLAFTYTTFWNFKEEDLKKQMEEEASLMAR